MLMVKTAAAAHGPPEHQGLVIFFQCKLVQSAKSRLSGALGRNGRLTDRQY